ncbi:MAG TPA: hypothetical protein VHX36_13650 [Candidatus Acidoferrales bacterium]|jgi:hypothetical protein|nr:hypothetical protein [Candidatus Acidoferrales bacterium]
MKMRTLAGAALASVLALGTASLACAGVLDHATRVTFGEDVRIPGQILPAGTYWFTIDRGSGMENVVHIYNRDRTAPIANLPTTTASVSQADVPTKAEVKLAVPQGYSRPQPPTVVSWFEPEYADGHQFVYSGERERELSREREIAVMGQSNVPVGQ